jgi:hypothetical protein
MLASTMWVRTVSTYGGRGDGVVGMGRRVRRSMREQRERWAREKRSLILGVDHVGEDCLDLGRRAWAGDGWAGEGGRGGGWREGVWVGWWRERGGGVPGGGETGGTSALKARVVAGWGAMGRGLAGRGKPNGGAVM